MGFQPQRPGRRHWINADILPPCGFVAAAMHLAMVDPAERNGKFIAGLAAEGTQLAEAQVVGIRGSPAADQAGLFDDVPDVVAVTDAPRLGERQNAFVDLRRVARVGHASSRDQRGGIFRFSPAYRDGRQFGCKCFLNTMRIGGGEPVLC